MYDFRFSIPKIANENGQLLPKQTKRTTQIVFNGDTRITASSTIWLAAKL